MAYVVAMELGGGSIILPHLNETLTDAHQPSTLVLAQPSTCNVSYSHDFGKDTTLAVSFLV